MKSRCFGCFVAILIFGTRTLIGQAPANDNFSNRTVLSGTSVAFSGSLSNATVESGEPPSADSFHYPNNGSIWWSWIATQSCPVVISVLRDYSAGPVQSAVLEVFSGTDLAHLQQLDYTPFDVPVGRYLKFMAVAGSNYQFRASGSVAGTFSAQLTASPGPLILRQPEGCTVSPYGGASFYVIAAGIPTPTNQWLFNGVPLDGETKPTLTVRNILTNNAGNYSVIVSNSGGAIESAAAVLSVTDTNPLPRVMALRPTNASTVPFLLTAEPGRWYGFEVTSNVLNWPQVFGLQWMSSFAQATNATNFYATLRTNAQTYVRVTLSSNRDTCVAQLKTMKAALDISMIENKLSPVSPYWFETLKPYLRLQPNGDVPWCPDGGSYWVQGDITNPPACTLDSIGHVIP